MSTITQLPVELIDQILVPLHNDAPALKACTLIHRSWLPSAQRQLFRSVRLTSANFKPLIASQSSYSSLVGHAQALTLGFHFVGFIEDQNWIGHPDVLLAIAAMFGGAHTLRVERLDFDLLAPEGKSALLDGIPQVRALVVAHCRFSRLSDFTRLVCSFNALDSLDFHGPAYPSVSLGAAIQETTLAAHGEGTSLTFMELADSACFWPLMPRWLETGVVRGLKSLCLYIGDERAPGAVFGLIRAAARSLETLRIDLKNPSGHMPLVWSRGEFAEPAFIS